MREDVKSRDEMEEVWFSRRKWMKMMMMLIISDERKERKRGYQRERGTKKISTKSSMDWGIVCRHHDV